METESKKDISEDKESAKPKKRRQPEDLGALAVKPTAPERVGAAAILAETKPAHREAQTSKNIETLSRAELLTLSEKILLDGTSLRQIYETHLVGENGLRRLVAEQLRGGDVKKALRQEIVERQIDFERDPALRDIGVYADLAAGKGNDYGKAALDKLLKHVDLAADNRNEEAAFFKARALYEADQLVRHKQQRRVIDTSVAAIIIVLVLLIVALFMSHS